MDLEPLLKKHRKKRLFDPEELSCAVHLSGHDVERTVPHRYPFLFLEHITHVDLPRLSIAGVHEVKDHDPVFLGHFPGDPTYPGCLQVEALGQLCTALGYFVSARREGISAEIRPPFVRVTKVMRASFFEPVRPGCSMILLGSWLEWDGLMATFVAQAMVNSKVVCLAAGQLCLIEQKAQAPR